MAAEKVDDNDYEVSYEQGMMKWHPEMGSGLMRRHFWVLYGVETPMGYCWKCAQVVLGTSRYDIFALTADLHRDRTVAALSASP